MHCTNCGNLVNDTDKFCASCGHQIEKTKQETEKNETPVQSATTEIAPAQPATPQPASQPKFSGCAITGFVLSLVGTVFAGLILGLLGLIFSSIGLHETKENTKRGKGLAIAGLVIAIVDIVLMIMFYASGYSTFEGGLI